MIRILLFLLIISKACFAQDIKVTDGDTLKIDGIKYRLAGIDAPEKKQTCLDKNGKFYPCGEEAKRYLTMLVNGENQVKCSETKNKDVFKRIIAICHIGTENINSSIVRSGHAVSWCVQLRVLNNKSLDGARRICLSEENSFVEEEEKAEKEHLGIWKGGFQYPKKFRKERK